MKINASAVANYFIELANNDEVKIRQLGLMKRIYIAHGFSLAILNKPLLDSRFDQVEAWRYGPVIPSIYHSFKHYGDREITEKTSFWIWDERQRKMVSKIPDLEHDNDAKEIVEMVWKRYKGVDDSAIVELTHQPNSPWGICYKEGENRPIPDNITQYYYQKLLEKISKRNNEL